MRKIKIFITLFILYEFLMITILQIPGYCRTFFNSAFCNVGNFKYFLMCIMLPGCTGLFFWWIPEISRIFCRGRCQCDETHPEIKTIREATPKIISQDDIERLVNAAIIMGIKKFTKSHPKTIKTVDNIIDALKSTKKIKKK